MNSVTFSCECTLKAHKTLRDTRGKGVYVTGFIKLRTGYSAGCSKHFKGEELPNLTYPFDVRVSPSFTPRPKMTGHLRSYWLCFKVTEELDGPLSELYINLVPDFIYCCWKVPLDLQDESLVFWLWVLRHLSPAISKVCPFCAWMLFRMNYTEITKLLMYYDNLVNIYCFFL